MLGDQTLPDPPSGMALLARSILIGAQPGIDHRHPRSIAGRGRAEYALRGGGTASSSA